MESKDIISVLSKVIIDSNVVIDKNEEYLFFASKEKLTRVCL